jgi:hypothetical protein
MEIRDAKDQSITEEDWNQISALLRESWSELWRAVNDQSEPTAASKQSASTPPR